MRKSIQKFSIFRKHALNMFFREKNGIGNKDSKYWRKKKRFTWTNKMMDDLISSIETFQGFKFNGV